MQGKDNLDDDIVTADNVISINEFSFKRAAKKPFDSCKHTHLEYDDAQHLIECSDCHQFIENYTAFKLLIDKFHRLQTRIDSQKRMLDSAMEKTVTLRAAQKVETAWRSRSMVPACPHCHEAIFATDGLGGHMMSKDIALRRKAISK